MALSSGADQNQTVSRILNKLHYALTHTAADITTGATGDIIIMLDASDNYEPKYADAANIMEMTGASRTVSLGNEDATISVANSGRTHIIANVSADRTFTLPAVADATGCDFLFVASVGAADGHDWIFATDATDELFAGGVLMIDTDAGPATAAAVVADQSDDDAFQVNLPQGGTWIRITSDGTNWNVSGVVLSTAAAAFS